MGYTGIKWLQFAVGMAGTPLQAKLLTCSVFAEQDEGASIRKRMRSFRSEHVVLDSKHGRLGDFRPTPRMGSSGSSAVDTVTCFGGTPHALATTNIHDFEPTLLLYLSFAYLRCSIPIGRKCLSSVVLWCLSCCSCHCRYTCTGFEETLSESNGHAQYEDCQCTERFSASSTIYARQHMPSTCPLWDYCRKCTGLHLAQSPAWN